MKIIYSRGFPYGAPLAMIRGGATRDPDVKAAIKAAGFRYDGSKHAFTHYLYGDAFAEVLCSLRDGFGVEVLPKGGLDPNYILDL